ncbi:long-subunit fatty acid transport protein [Rhodovulum imhoffii]|uniref:Long-subunit fatty acid transport protein n=1 Tax=Rhodovulum imhoffii TaxID=365340 RepID=A0A2T5BNJ9_9RHOB|nr:hypothetical protein [Rhodovulum imhoffii]MBK5934617.1 hypothetical protein [Rhodovulum imhoffii]PTN00555.1 long-subunit fatty acid transport protein [Rhodovulum imhoffii]
MLRIMGGASTIALCASSVLAGGVERSSQSTAILFEKGNYLEFSVGHVAPDVGGTQAIPTGPFSPAGVKSGDMTGDYTTYALGFKAALSENIDAAIVLDSPIGADVEYKPDTGYIYGGSSLAIPGSTASLDASAVTAMLKYRFPNNVSIFGGVRSQSVKGQVDLFTGYTMGVKNETELGYLVGIAYERPQIAMRVALTYNSAITHDFKAREAILGTPILKNTEFSTEVPQSLNLEFQTGIAADTLLFGSVRWVDWSAFDITPEIYELAYQNALVSYDDDTITYQIGLGRKFNDTWSGAISVAHEPSVDGFAGNLGPTDGFTSVGLAATYTREKFSITGGVRYIWIGDADTEAPKALTGGREGVKLGKFDDNDGYAFGLKMAYRF